MIAFAAGSREKADELYARAIELGASDEGPPGERMPGFYGGYFRDPDGNKAVFFHMG
jgi:predicted lactoylglutathione lyase